MYTELSGLMTKRPGSEKTSGSLEPSRLEEKKSFLFGEAVGNGKADRCINGIDKGLGTFFGIHGDIYNLEARTGDRLMMFLNLFHVVQTEGAVLTTVEDHNGKLLRQFAGKFKGIAMDGGKSEGRSLLAGVNHDEELQYF